MENESRLCERTADASKEFEAERKFVVGYLLAILQTDPFQIVQFEKGKGRVSVRIKFKAVELLTKIIGPSS